MATASLSDRPNSAACGITLTHEIAAPAWIVYEAFTRPELVRRWWGTSGLTTTCHADVRPGGSYAYESRGAEHRQRYSGTYTVVEPERLVYTLIREEELLRLPAVVTVSFFDANHRTLVTSTFRYSSPAAFEAALDHGLEQSTAERFERLAAFVAALL